MTTIKDIARALRVSTATVSKALNGYTDINPLTAELVRKKAEELKYRPNIAARQLKTNSSHNIGVLFVDEMRSGLTHEYFSRILNSAKEELEHLGYDITFISNSIAGKRASFLEHARYRNCDGVIIACVDFENPEVYELVHSEIPTITIDYPFDQKSCVMSDNLEGTYQLTEYLLDMGHRKIACISGEPTLVTRKRMNGFRRALKERGVQIPDCYLLQGNYHDTKRSAELTEQLMALPEPPSVIMYPDDFAYIGGMSALEKLKLSVPEDVSCVGYDGIPLSQCLRPRLTTYQQDSESIGRLSARKLVEHIDDKNACVPEQIMVKGRLIPGKTVLRLSNPLKG